MNTVVFTTTQAVAAPLEYKTIVLDEPVSANPTPRKPYSLTQERLLQYAQFGAVAKAPIRKLGLGRFRRAGASQVATLRSPKWVIASVSDNKIVAPESSLDASWSANRAMLQQLNRQAGGAQHWQLIPEYEVTR